MGDWLSCDPLRGSHDSQSSHIWGDWLSCDSLRGSHDSQSPHIRKHLCPILIYLSQIYSYYIRGDRSPLIFPANTQLSYNICTMLNQRRNRADAVQMLYTCFVFAEFTR